MSIQEQKVLFEQQRAEKVYESRQLVFHGVEGFDVYNCSIPFQWEGKTYMYSRVEHREEWARSWVRLFEQTGPDEYSLVPQHMIYQLEDPFISIVQGELVLGGTHVRMRSGEIDTYYGYFYRGAQINNLRYFTTGPEHMKDIRLLELKDGRIGVFSRPNNPEIREKYGSAAMIGFAIIDSLDQLTDEVVLNARPIEGIFDTGEWGGCNQPILLENGSIGVIGHQSFTQTVENGTDLAVYVNTAFEFDPHTFTATGNKIIATRSCYPDFPAKKPQLVDCTFTSGIVMRDDGKVDLYGGMGDAAEGRIVVDYPFSAPLSR